MHKSNFAIKIIGLKQVLLVSVLLDIKSIMTIYIFCYFCIECRFKKEKKLIYNNILHKNIYSNNFLEDMIYDNIVPNKIFNIIQNIENVNTIIMDINPDNEIDYAELKNKFGDEADDIYPFVNNSDLLENNRFHNKHIIQNALSLDSCYWILNECFKCNNWSESIYANYDTYLNIELIPHVFNFLTFISNFWIMNVKKLYNLNKTNVSINNIFITKYTNNEKKNNNFYKDESLLILTVALNNISDYENGSIIFESDKEEKILLKQGDMLIYNGKCLRNRGDVTNGEKYYLVLFLDILIN